MVTGWQDKGAKGYTMTGIGSEHTVPDIDSSKSAEAIVALRLPFVDTRGEILNLIDAPFESVAVIRSIKGAVRANHYHKTDFHYCWLQKGALIYAHRPVGSVSAPKEWIVRPGQMFYTPPMYEHVMLFTEESVMVVVARNSRQMNNYEADTVRIKPLPVRERS